LVIRTITMPNPSAVDLNLLWVLHAVLAERSATRAARRLHVTQSAVSNALARLRALFGDPLVVRSGRGLAPTPRAQALAPSIAAALGQIQSLLEDGEPFDARQSTRQFTLACSDAEQAVVLPALAALFARRLPRARLRAVSIDYLLAAGGLAAGEVDVSLGPGERAAPAPGFHRAELYREEAVVVARRDHPEIGKNGRRMTPALFNSLRHVEVLVAMGRGGALHAAANDLYARQGMKRQVAVSVAHFSAAALTVARTDLIAAMPRRLAETFARTSPLKVWPLPGQPFRFVMNLHWHDRTHLDEGARAFRQAIVDALADPVRPVARA
jgi:DNA-binding transcriptional LysR family regulator